MRLGIDGKRLVQARTGPARWLEHMLHQWAAAPVPFEEVRCYTPASTAHRWTNPPTLQHVVLPTRLPVFYWENVTLRRALWSDDILFGASYTIPLGFRGRSVVSIQGIYEGPNAERVPWWYRYRYSAMYKASARRADLVLANSISTKNDLVEYYGTDPDKIRIVYQGVGPPFGWQDDREIVARRAAAVVGHDGPYLLFVGKMSHRRNVPGLLRAFSDARRLPDETRFVFVGPNHVNLDFDRHVAETKTGDRVTHIPHLEQDDLASAYSGATAFFLPTTHEGLSATILEAMACGTPVVTVDHAPLREGFREHALVLEQPTHELLRDAITQVVTEPDLREQLSRAGRECAARFTWRRTAEETMDALWEVAQRRTL